MTVLLVIGTFVTFLVIDYFKSRDRVYVPRGTCYTTRGFEMLGALSQDGGEVIENDYQI
jgi:hypothetical protein